MTDFAATIKKLKRAVVSPDYLWLALVGEDEAGNLVHCQIHCDELMGLIQYAAYASTFSHEKRGLDLPFFESRGGTIYAMPDWDHVGLALTLGEQGHLRLALEAARAEKLGKLLLDAAAKIRSQTSTH